MLDWKKKKEKKAALTIDESLMESDSSDSEDEIPTKCSHEKDTTLFFGGVDYGKN